MESAAQNEPRTVVITGTSAGVGRAAARQWLDLGWRVIGTGRDPQRCREANRELGEGNFIMLCADLSQMDAVARLAAEIAALAPRIDVLCNNAGGVVAERRVTADGLEETFAANHLAAFLLTLRLIRNLVPDARVITTSSDGHTHVPGMNWEDLALENGWSSGRAYCQAKLANVLFTRELARRFGDRLVAHALHPGNVDSNFASHCEPRMKAYMESIRPQAIMPEQAAKALVWLGTSETAGRINGRYFEELNEAAPAPAGQDDAAAAQLWEVSKELLTPWLDRNGA